MEALTARELEIIALVRQAKSNRQIGQAIGLTTGTVNQYVHRILQKLDLPNRTALAMWRPE